MNTQHTPGPWVAYPTGLARSGLPEYQIHWSDIGECVAETVHGDENARLIAAAPELLEALISARKLWGDYLPARSSAAMRSIRLVDAAIAKATGVAQ